MFWGKPDSSVDFCEDKYVNNQYIAEYNNTWSCIFYLVPALLYRNTKIHNIAVCLFFLWIGSTLLHGTLRYYGQWLDEISMLSVSYMTIQQFKKDLPNYFLGLIILIYLYFWNTFCIFFLMFTVMQIILVNNAKKHINDRNIKYINLYILSFSLGLLCWFLDQFACNYFKLYNLHAFWHFFTAMAITSGYAGFLLI